MSMSSREDASRMHTAVVRVAASRWSNIILRRVVRTTEAVSAAARHAIARVVVGGVVALAVANLDSGLVLVFVVVEAHVAGWIGAKEIRADEK